MEEGADEDEAAYAARYVPFAAPSFLPLADTSEREVSHVIGCASISCHTETLEGIIVDVAYFFQPMGYLTLVGKKLRWFIKSYLPSGSFL